MPRFDIMKFFRRDKPKIVQEHLIHPNRVDWTTLTLDKQMILTRKWESAVYPLFKIGNVIETTIDDVPFMFCTGPDCYFDNQNLPGGTKFVVADIPSMNENGTYTSRVLLNGREALIDIYHCYEGIKIA